MDGKAQRTRSASQYMGMAELIWTAVCERGRCEPRRPRGPVAVPRRADVAPASIKLVGKRGVNLHLAHSLLDLVQAGE
jgi:hypothetical protein